MSAKPSRDAILECALDLLIRHGYRGPSFGDIAEQLGMTRANIHYHFGSKQALIEQVLADYVENTLAALREIWRDSDGSFEQRIEAVIAYSLRRARRYNAGGHAAQPWSLISRLRQDADLLAPEGRAHLSRFTRELNRMLVQSLSAEVGKGTLRPDTPVKAVAAQLALIADNASAITHDAGSTRHLAAVYRGFAQLVLQGFGTDPRKTHAARQ